MPSSRREFLLRSVAAAGACRAVAAAAQNTPSFAFPTKARDRIAVTSWPFRGYIQSPTNRGRISSLPGMDLLEFPAMVAEKFSVFNINPLADHFRSIDSAYLESFRNAVAKARSHIVDLGLPGRDVYSSDPDAQASVVSFGRMWIDKACILESPSVRQHLVLHNGEKPQQDVAAQVLGRLADYAAKRNIVINLENDSPASENPFFLVGVIEKVDNPYLRALPDFGNSLDGHDPAYNERAVAAMFRHAWNMCHVKSAIQSDDGKVLSVDLRKMFAIAKASAFAGYYSMELDTPSNDPFEETSKLVQATLQYLT